MKHPKIEVTVFSSSKGVEKVILAPAPRWKVTCTFAAARQWLSDYLLGQPASPLHWLAWHSFTPFQKKVYEALSEVPFGKTISYGQLAKQVGAPQAHRAVGSCMAKNAFPLILPCHRVLTSTGSLGGFAFGTDMKKELIQFEASKQH